MTDEQEGSNHKEMLAGCLYQTLQMSKKMKSHFSEQANGKIDIQPFIVVGLDGEDEEGNHIIGGGVVELQIENEHPVDALPKLLSKLHEEGLQKFAWLSFIIEGYSRRVEITDKEGLEKLRHQERGELEKEFNEKIDTDVEEGIIASIFSWTGDCIAMTSYYKWGDDGLPIYEEEDEDKMLKADVGRTSEMEGRIPDIFDAFIKYCQMCELLNINTEGEDK